MKFKAIIVGIRDFVSSKGRPLRQIFCTADTHQDGLIGQAAFVVWQFQDSDYFGTPAKELLGKSCVCLEFSGKSLILAVDGVDHK